MSSLRDIDQIVFPAKVGQANGAQIPPQVRPAGRTQQVVQRLSYRGNAKSVDPRFRADDAKGNFRRRVLNALFCMALALSANGAFAQAATDPTPLQFTSTAEERRFHALVSELRCVMCQNQSLADSNAQIAVDLRHEVLALMRSGKSDAQVKDYLVARYGEFVLYRPRVESSTWLLWFGPALLLLAGGFVIAGVVRKRSARPAVAPDDSNQEW
jgi:cytochrome c-type biogenesis protein CcmH